MTPLQTWCLDAFPGWLRSLAEDARKLAAILESASLPESARRSAAVALSYLFKSLDLIPDGLEDLGFVDDAFVFRVAAATVSAEDAKSDQSGTLSRLKEEAGLVREFLSDAYPRLEAYVGRLDTMAVRGRTVPELLSNAGTLADFVRDARQWAEAYEPPAFLRDEKNLIKLRSFLTARLK
jgi:uncharacterized membrane protein YkvA (DUF1232 family)